MTDLISLDKLLSRVVDNRGKTCPTADNGLPLIATNCVKNDGLFPTLEKVRYVSEETYREWFRGHPEPGDLIFVTKGAPGQVCLAPDPVNFCIAQDMVALRADNAEVYPPYLFAALRSRRVQDAIVNMHVGTMIPHFKKGDFDKLLIPRPDREMQHFIGDMYLLFSRKIDLNRRMNETLEAMARAIFKDWFVDFGPTRAKMEGRAPYLARELSALFPDRLDGEGKPQGWNTEPILKYANLLSGGTPKTAEPAYWGGPIRWASAKDVSQCGEPFLLETERSITARGLEESSTRMIPSLSTVIVARGATTGRFCMFGSDIAMNQTCYALSTKASRPFWINCIFASLVDSIVHAAHGSVFNTITTTTIEGAMTIVPSNALLDEFESVVRPLFMKILKNTEVSRTLEATRDLLLPKLMSGEIQLREAEKALEAEAVA